MNAPSLPGFARFLLDTHLDEFTRLNVERAREVQLPLLKLFRHLSPEELFAFSRQSLAAWLGDLVEGRAWQAHQESLLRWQQNLMPEISRQSVQADDLALSAHTRKFALYQLLSEYATTVADCQLVVQQIEEFYTRCLTASMQAFMDVQGQVLQQEKDLLQTVIDTTEEGMMALDGELTVTLWNCALEKRTGVPKDRILGKQVFDLFPQNEPGEEKQALLKALQGEKQVLQNQPIRARSGYYDMQVVPLQDLRGAIVGVLSVTRDVTAKESGRSAASLLRRNKGSAGRNGGR